MFEFVVRNVIYESEIISSQLTSIFVIKTYSIYTFNCLSYFYKNLPIIAIIFAIFPTNKTMTKNKIVSNRKQATVGIHSSPSLRLLPTQHTIFCKEIIIIYIQSNAFKRLLLQNITSLDACVYEKVARLQTDFKLFSNRF